MLIPPDVGDAPDLEASLAFSCRGVWSNCNHAGMLAVSRLLTDPTQRSAVDAERRGASGLLASRVAAWNTAARPLGLRYPRYEGGFFVTVESSDPKAHAAALRERNAFLVPLQTSLRVALCSVATRHVGPLAASIAAVVGR